MTTDTTCRCGRPTRNNAYACDDCADKLQKALGEVPFVDTELETSAAKQAGIDYRRLGGSKGGKKPAEMPGPANMAAADARTHLNHLLIYLAGYCNKHNVRNSDPRDGLPAHDSPALSRWLLWRVDGLMFHDKAPVAVKEISEAVNAGLRIIDRPADKQYLGDCTKCDGGRLYSPPNGEWARCNTCDSVSSADPVRRELIKKLEDRLCTLAEIADLSTYMGLHATREQVRNRLKVWHHRKVINPASKVNDVPVFLVGDVWRLLVHANDQETGRKVG